MTTTENDNPMVTQILAQLRATSEEVASIDSQLGLGADATDTAKRNAVAEKIVPKYSERYGNLSRGVIKAINDGVTSEDGAVDAEMLAGLYRGLISTLQTQFSKTVNDYLDTRKGEVEVSTLSIDERAELEKRRRDLAKVFGLGVDMLPFYGFERDEKGAVILPSDIQRPSRKQGSRGVNFHGEYNYYLNGKMLKDADLSQIANQYCKPLNWTTRDLKDFIVETLNLTPTTEGKKQVVDAGPDWSVQLPMPVNKTLAAKLVSNTDVDDDDEPETENGESEGDVSF